MVESASNGELHAANRLEGGRGLPDIRRRQVSLCSESWIAQFQSSGYRRIIATGLCEAGNQPESYFSRNLRSTIDLLAKERTHVIPSHKEWVAETKVENITKNDGRDPREER